MKRRLTNVIEFKASNKEYEVTLQKGIYYFQLWGSSSGYRWNLTTDGCKYATGRGAYVAGILRLGETKNFYVYVGDTKTKFCNGSSDVRLIRGKNWYDFESLKSRIIVAGSAGEGEHVCSGDAGGLEGMRNNITYGSVVAGEPGTQTSGGRAGYYGTYGRGYDGKFGIAGSAGCLFRESDYCDAGADGGGGYFGGGGTSYAGAGGGGSSFISGHPGCNAISNESTDFDNIISTNQSIHYSSLYFEQTVMNDGYSNRVYPFGRQINNTGFARITQLDGSRACTHKLNSRIPSQFVLITLFYSS